MKMNFFKKNKIIMKTNSEDVVYAGEWEEFYYDDSDQVVPEGEPVGLDVDTPDGVELVLFSNIYWNPQYHDYED